MYTTSKNGKFYLYYPEAVPDNDPDGCEFLDHTGKWLPDDGTVSYSTNPRRWPVKEWQYRAYHWILAHGVRCPKGYEVVGFGVSDDPNLHILQRDGHIRHPYVGKTPHPLLIKLEPEVDWIRPTDEDVIRCIKETGKRPVVQVRDVDSEEWDELVLYGIDDDGAEFPFMTGSGSFRQCRMNAKLREEWK